MIRGARRPEEVQALGVSRRLLVRVGALLKKNVEITEAVLETARPGTPHEALLLDPALLEQAAELDEERLRALAGKHLGAAAAALTVAPGEAPARVICLREELETTEAWSAAEAPPGATPPPAQDAQPPVSAPLATTDVPARSLAPRLAPGSASAEALFTPVELDRLRLKLVTASQPAERIEALRLLAYAPLPMHEKAEVIFRALEDRHADVRAEGAALLSLLGVSDELAEAMQALTAADEANRLRAADRLLHCLTTETPDLGRAAVAVTTLASLKLEPPGASAAKYLEILALCAPALAAAAPRVAELIRVCMRLLSAALGRDAPPRTAERLTPPLLRLLRSLAQAAPAVVQPLLREERGKAADRAVEAFLLQVLLDAAPAGTPEEEELLKWCAQFIAHDTEEGRDSRVVGMSMAARGEAAVRPLVAVFAEATPSGQRYILRLTDDLVRYRKVSGPGREQFAEIVLRAMDSTYRPLRMTAMSCRGLAHEDVSEPLRAKLAEAFLASLTDFAFRADREIAEDTVALLGLPAVEPLRRHLAPERPPDQRIQAARLVGKLALELKPSAGQMVRATEAVTDLLRLLQGLALEPSFPDRRELLTATGKLVASPAATREAAEVVTRHLLADVRSGDAQRHLQALEGLTWVASSRRAQAELIEVVVSELQRTLEQAQTEITAQTREVDGELVIEIPDDHGLTELVPVALGGVSRIACSRSCPPHVIRGLVDLLTGHWRKILAGEILWGPGNAAHLVRALQDVGSSPNLPPDLRLQILKALAPRLMYAPVLPAVGAILAAADGPATSGAALALGLAITNQRGSDGKYPLEDREDILRVLGKVAGRKHLGATDAAGQEKARRFREAVLDDLFRGAQEMVPGAYEALLAVRDAKVLPAEVQATLERRLADFHALALPVS